MEYPHAHEPQNPIALARHYLGDLIYGANDGLITTFAVVSGVTGAGLEPRLVLILGLASLLADGLSMGASNYLAIRSDEGARRADGLSEREPFPLRHAAATFTSFVLIGSIPLLSYVTDLGDAAFAVATVLTMGTLFVVGAARSIVTDTTWFRGGTEMFVVGLIAAAVAFGVGALIADLVP